MATERIIPGEIRIFLNHIYEFKKGVRNMVLYTMSKEHEEFAIRRLKNQKISYMIQEVGTNKINLFFGKAECMEAMRHIIIRPLWSPFPVGDKPWRNFFQLEIDHLIATDHHGTILLIEGVDDTL